MNQANVDVPRNYPVIYPVNPDATDGPLQSLFDAIYAATALRHWGLKDTESTERFNHWRDLYNVNNNPERTRGDGRSLQSKTIQKIWEQARSGTNSTSLQDGAGPVEAEEPAEEPGNGDFDWLDFIVMLQGPRLRAASEAAHQATLDKVQDWRVSLESARTPV
jgi:hypothetical protein